jgi:pilus assembly protein FimV
VLLRTLRVGKPLGRTITAAILAASLTLAAPLIAQAAGLGRLIVLSPLGQPLNAEIEIVALRPGEEEELVARIAPPEAFTEAGIEPTHVLSGMRFTVERRDGRRFLRVTTPAPVNEPFVELLVELQWSTGRLVREYTFLLDPPEYKAKARDAIAAAPPPPPSRPALAEPVKPAAPIAAKPLEVAPPPPVITPSPAEPEKPAAAAEAAKEPANEPAKEAAKEEPAKPAAEDEKAHEVTAGDTLAAIARANLPPGVTLNQMLIALYRANESAFINQNVNLVRAGRILNIPSGDAIGTVDVEEANRVVRTHMAEFREYRSRLAAVPATADAAPGQREAAGRIEPKPEAPKPAAPGDQVRLSKVDPQKPAAAGARAAREDDLVARERALREAQSRITDLEKTVSDLQKMLEIRNQQLAEMQKKAGEKPAPTPAVPPPAAKAPEKPAAKAAEKPAAEAPKPAPGPAPAPAPGPIAQAPEKPAAQAPKPAAPIAKPAPKPAAAPPPEPSLFDEVLDNPVALAGLGGVVLLLLVYALVAWRKKKTVHAKFQDSVIGAAAAGASISEPTFGAATPSASQPGVSQLPPGLAAEEVDPIAEADVYMAYGRDSQAEEILKEALQKDPNRTPVHAKLLELYAKRRDIKAFEQTALKLKNVTRGAGPEWDKAVALGHSIDPQNGLYAGAAAAAAAVAAAPAAPAPTLDFDIGGAQQASASSPDLTLDSGPKASDAPLDFDVSGTSQKEDRSAEETVVAPASRDTSAGGLDFNLDLGTPAEEAPAPGAPAAADPGLTFDLNLDLGGEKQAEAEKAAPPPDLSTISLDLGSMDASGAAASGTDPKWQEIATKLDLAKAYEEMGDKDGARELLNEVIKDGDAAQKGQAQQLLAKLG